MAGVVRIRSGDRRRTSTPPAIQALQQQVEPELELAEVAGSVGGVLLEVLSG